MARLIRTKQLSAIECLDAHLRQIERWNGETNAIVTLVAEQARIKAKEADDATASGAPLGVLHGLPMAHKDTHRTKGIRTTFGSPLFATYVPDTSDIIVERLHRSGAIAIGKTNVPEFAAGSQTFNTVFGATRNPYDLALTPGGSSGGAAVALALGMHPLADGSDMGGSLRNPASFCNVVGFRPSFGRVPSFPTNVADERLSVPGAMARCVDDVAMMMSAIAGPDPRTPSSFTEGGEAFVDLFSGAPLRLRVAWSPDLGGAFPLDRQVRDALAHAPAVFEALGWEVVDELPDLRDADEVFRVIRAAQFAEAFGTSIDRHPDAYKAAIHWNVAIGRSLSEHTIALAKQRQREIVERVNTFFDDVDLLALAVSQVPPFPVEWEYPPSIDGVAMGDYLEWMASCYEISVTTSPAISIPFGFGPTGLPIGLQLVAAPGRDVLLLEAAHAVEAAVDLPRAALVVEGVRRSGDRS